MIGHDRKNFNAIKEWIIFTISLGLGAHIVLGLMLHSPDSWPTQSLWWYGPLISLSVYIVVQLGRSLWWVMVNHFHAKPSGPPEK